MQLAPLLGVAGPAFPLDLGPAADGAEAGAGRVDQDPVELYAPEPFRELDLLGRVSYNPGHVLYPG